MCLSFSILTWFPQVCSAWYAELVHYRQYCCSLALRSHCRLHWGVHITASAHHKGENMPSHQLGVWSAFLFVGWFFFSYSISLLTAKHGLPLKRKRRNCEGPNPEWGVLERLDLWNAKIFTRTNIIPRNHGNMCTLLSVYTGCKADDWSFGNTLSGLVAYH